MPTFSIKNLLVAVSMVCFACLVLTNPSMTMAKVMMVIVAISILALNLVGFWLRRPLVFVLAFLSIGYLVIADGGMFPSAERYLPSEWGLRRCCHGGVTEMFNGIKPNRPNSLTKWALSVDRNHNDWGYLYPVKPVTNTDKNGLIESQQDTNDVLDDLLDLAEPDPSATPVGLTVQLPVLTVTKVSTVVSVGPRSNPQNRPLFIVAHCLILTLILVVAITYFIAMSKRTSRFTTNARQPSLSQ